MSRKPPTNPFTPSPFRFVTDRHHTLPSPFAPQPRFVIPPSSPFKPLQKHVCNEQVIDSDSDLPQKRKRSPGDDIVTDIDDTTNTRRHSLVLADSSPPFSSTETPPSTAEFTLPTLRSLPRVPCIHSSPLQEPTTIVQRTPLQVYKAAPPYLKALKAPPTTPHTAEVVHPTRKKGSKWVPGGFAETVCSWILESESRATLTSQKQEKKVIPKLLRIQSSHALVIDYQDQRLLIVSTQKDLLSKLRVDSCILTGEPVSKFMLHDTEWLICTNWKIQE